jgi:hypothetical protein
MAFNDALARRARRLPSPVRVAELSRVAPRGGLSAFQRPAQFQFATWAVPTGRRDPAKAFYKNGYHLRIAQAQLIRVQRARLRTSLQAGARRRL